MLGEIGYGAGYEYDGVTGRIGSLPRADSPRESSTVAMRPGGTANLGGQQWLVRAGAVLAASVLAVLTGACVERATPARLTSTVVSRPPPATATVVVAAPSATTTPMPPTATAQPPTAVPTATPAPRVEVAGTLVYVAAGARTIEIQPEVGSVTVVLTEATEVTDPQGRRLTLYAVPLNTRLHVRGVRGVRGSPDMVVADSIELRQALVRPTATQSRPSQPATTPDPAVQRTEPCPLNGAIHTKAEQAAWDTRRPLGVMIENHADARPQFGLSVADVVYEAVAEGGITRFLAVYYCDGGTEPVRVGPIRSARTYFLDWLSEYGLNPLYAHVGGAACDRRTGSGCLNGARADALGQIRAYGWAAYNDLDEFSIGPPTFWRDPSRGVATEHTMFSELQRLWSVGERRGLTAVDAADRRWDETFTPWRFSDRHVRKVLAPSASVAVDFWQRFPDFSVVWVYDPWTNTYARVMGGVPHTDALTGRQIRVATVIVQFQTESAADDGYFQNLHLLYGTLGTGRAKIIQNGLVIEATWRKPSREARTSFYDQDGNEVRLSPGKIWVQTISVSSKVTVQ